ncbi:tryptase beta-2-like isoform X2 [Phlebotomus argentipes]|uniref:tryptase beta-2-like isoform X2 n=1 Tax=Phlebotomus argentipes TaxID=94469 RepID=UPI002892DCF1|nr:tryptase beta-2-like isoform X2 [Phlebotomus argentipes]
MITPWFILLAIATQTSLAVAQASGDFWWLNSQLISAAEERRAGKRIGDHVRIQDVTENVAGDCSCVPKCQCDDPPRDIVFSDEKKEICARSSDICCHIMRLPIPANCSASITFTENTLEGRGPFTIKDFPWLLGLSMDKFPNTCGAALLTSTAAVTAAHCVSDKHPSAYSVRTIEGQERMLSEVIKHTGYYSGGRFNDLALIKWVRPLPEPQGSKVIKLADGQDFTDEDASCFAIELENDKPVPLNVMPPFLCEAILREGHMGKRFQLHASFLCAVPDLPGTCKAQGGNLLVCNQQGSIPVLAGVASWGFKCNEPRIFTNVSVFSDWIHDNLVKYYF